MTPEILPGAAAISRRMNAHKTVVAELEAYLLRYVTFPANDAAFALALWAASTYLWEHFDAFPYLTITSDTKRSGKTRLSELLAFVSRNPMNMAGMTAATLFRSIRDSNPTIFIDEAENLSSGSADTLRSVLNVGYRRGQTIPRTGLGGVVEHWPAYCPKVFILIGDVFDTLRDRSIIIRMQRGTAAQRFLYEIAKGEGTTIANTFRALFEVPRPKATTRRRAGDITDILDTFNDEAPPAPTALALAIFETYTTHATLDFLSDRDAEIWMPLFAVATHLCPDRLDELTRVAVDMSTEKTAKVRKHSALEMEAAERDASDAEYAERLLADVLFAIGNAKGLYTTEAIDKLYALPTGPWRKFRGVGLTVHDMAKLLDRFGVHPKLIRTGKKVARGYARTDIEAAVSRL